MARKTYKDYLDKTVEEIKRTTRKGAGRRLPAMALYLQDFSLSVQDVAELLEIRPGTAIRWSTEDEWNKNREQIKENIKKEILDTAQTKHAKQLQQAISNLILSLVESSDQIPVLEMKDIKSLVDSIEKLYKIFGDLHIIERQAEKVELEHKGEIKHNNRYEQHIDKFSEMLDEILPQEEEEDNEE